MSERENERALPIPFFTEWATWTPLKLMSVLRSSIRTKSMLYDNKVWRYQRGNQNPHIEEEQTTQWPKEKVQKNKQRSTKHTHKTKDWVTRTSLKTRGELRCSRRISSVTLIHVILSMLLSKTYIASLSILRGRDIVEQELLTLLEHLSSPLVFSEVRVTRSFFLTWEVDLKEQCSIFFLN
jgi:hypothetical protein